MQIRTVYFLLIFILISLIPLFKYHFLDKNIPELPEYTSYKEAITKELPDKIKEKATLYRCKNYVLPVNKLEGNNNLFPNLKEDINLALTSYKKWKLKVSKEVRQKMKKRKEEQIRKWGGFVSGKELERLLIGQKEASLRTNYSVVAKLLALPDKKGNNRKLIVTVNNESTSSKLFDVAVTFADPKLVENWNDSINRKRERIEKSRKISIMGIYSALLFSIILILMIIVSMIIEYIKKRKIKRIKDELLQQIDKRQDLIDNGHFVAALELADRYLQYFPNDIEIKAFRERLLDYTNNDPKKAQQAYVEAKKLQMRLKQANQMKYLTSSEKQNLTNLLQYNPELKTSFNKMLDYEEKGKKEKEFEDDYKLILNLINAKKLTQADIVLRKLEHNYIGYSKLENLRQELDETLKRKHEEFLKIKKILLEGKIKQAYDDLSNLLNDFKDFSKGKVLLNQMENSRKNKKYILKSKTNEDDILIFCKNQIIIGRKDDNVFPDIEINNRYISRPHIKLEIKDNEVYVTDLETTGGNYIRGEKISKVRLLNNDIITLAKVVDMKVLIYRDTNGILNGIKIFIQNSIYIILKSKINFDNDINKDQYNENILFNEYGIIVLKLLDKYYIIYDGQKIETGDTEYIVKSIKATQSK